MLKRLKNEMLGQFQFPGLVACIVIAVLAVVVYVVLIQGR